MGINAKHLREYVIVPILQALGWCYPEYIDLMMGTCAQESAMGTYLVQQNSGPALGIYQIEPKTYNYVISWLTTQRDINRKFIELFSIHNLSAKKLITDLSYSTAIALFVYLSKTKDPVPYLATIEQLAHYYKVYYNSPAGAATEQQFIDNYKKYVL